jgi:hypothetical protein
MTKKALLPYGTEPSFPAIEMTYTVEWDGHLAGKARDTLTAKAEAIKSDYEALTNLAKDTEFVNAIEKRYEVQVGKSYWVYENKQGSLFLSIIEPHEWNHTDAKPPKYIGQFLLSPDGTWIRESHF